MITFCNSAMQIAYNTGLLVSFPVVSHTSYFHFEVIGSICSVVLCVCISALICFS